MSVGVTTDQKQNMFLTDKMVCWNSSQNVQLWKLISQGHLSPQRGINIELLLLSVSPL